MPMVTGELLEGPRGRRVCLEWALACERPLIDENPEEMWDRSLAGAVFSLPEPAYNRAYIVAVPIGSEDEDEDETADPEGLVEETTAQDVARVLGGVAVTEPDAGQALALLAEACALAAYWQPPYAPDVATADPEVRAGLEKVAAVIASAPATRWWSQAVDPQNQWLTREVPRPEWGVEEMPDAREPENPVEVLSTWRGQIVREEEAARASAAEDPEQCSSGTWWSTPPATLASSTRGLPSSVPLGVVCVEDGGGWSEVIGRSLEVSGSPRVFEINGSEDWARLCREHPLDVTHSKRGDWWRTTGRDGAWVVPDWSEVARHWDGVHLSVRGYLRTAGRIVEVDGDRASVLAGWDPDRTYWFCPTTTSDDLVTWEECEEEPGWRRA